MKARAGASVRVTIAVGVNVISITISAPKIHAMRRLCIEHAVVWLRQGTRLPIHVSIVLHMLHMLLLQLHRCFNGHLHDHSTVRSFNRTYGGHEVNMALVALQQVWTDLCHLSRRRWAEAHSRMHCRDPLVQPCMTDEIERYCNKGGSFPDVQLWHKQLEMFCTQLCLAEQAQGAQGCGARADGRQQLVLAAGCALALYAFCSGASRFDERTVQGLAIAWTLCRRLTLLEDLTPCAAAVHR